jgi:hypothetical protein
VVSVPSRARAAPLIAGDSTSRSRSKTRGASTLALLVTSLAGAGCGTPKAADAPRGHLVLPGGAAPALTALPGGELLVGFLRTGTIWRVPRTKPPRREDVPRLRVSTDGQRGLLGLAVVHGITYASWTTPGRRLVVGRLRPHAAPIIVWRGLRSTTLANGGHLASTPDGQLAIGIGDRQSGTPKGRMLLIDPQGPAMQRPRTLSTGWNNPFAFAYLPGGELWVADNAPGKRPERLARGDTAGPPAVTILGRRPAASGVAALGPRALALCGVVSGTLDRYTFDEGRWSYKGPIARGCRYGVVRLTDGRLAFSAADGVRTIQP